MVYFICSIFILSLHIELLFSSSDENKIKTLTGISILKTVMETIEL